MSKHGWFVVVRGLEGEGQWECAHTEMYPTKRTAERALRECEYHKDFSDRRLSFHLAKAVIQ